MESNGAAVGERGKRRCKRKPKKVLEVLDVEAALSSSYVTAASEAAAGGGGSVANSIAAFTTATDDEGGGGSILLMVKKGDARDKGQRCSKIETWLKAFLLK